MLNAKLLATFALILFAPPHTFYLAVRGFGPVIVTRTSSSFTPLFRVDEGDQQRADRM